MGQQGGQNHQHERTDGPPLLTPSKITAWLDCDHYLALQRAVDDGLIDPPHSPAGSFADLVMRKGREHEAAYRLELEAAGNVVVELVRLSHESFEAWAARTRNTMASGPDVIYQQPFSHDGMRGVADFLIRVPEPSDLGPFSYEPVDAKLARADANPGHVLQLCFYADAIAAIQGTRPEHMHLYLGSGQTQTIVVRDVEAYWRRLRQQLARTLAADAAANTNPQPCSHCQFCEFAEHCETLWRNADALHYVANIRRTDIDQLHHAGVTTLTTLANHDLDVDGVRPERRAILTRQARLQRLAVDAPTAPYERIGHDDPKALLPAPSDGDVFLDFEGHPFWSPAQGLFFLFGLIARDTNHQWVFHERWAHTPTEEADAVADLITWIAERRRQYPDMHVYHYNHTERSALQRLSIEHGVECATLGNLIADGVFVDIFDVIRHAVQIGVESYGLKSVEPLAAYVRNHDIDRGASAVIEYDDWMTDHDPARLVRIARYNEDDVRATLAVRDWLLHGPLADAEFRPPPEVPERDDADPHADFAALIGTDDAWKHLLAHLMDYWGREGRAHRAQRLAALNTAEPDQLTDPTVITNLDFTGLIEPTGRQRNPRARFTFPRQELSADLKQGERLMFPVDADGVTVQSATIDDIDADTGALTLVWNDDLDAIPTPSAMVHNDWVSPRDKPGVIADLAHQVAELGHTEPPRAPEFALLRAEPPRFLPGHGPVGGVFSPAVDDLTELAGHLDGSYLAVQGPPGTGKTYSGGHIIKRLAADHQRVGITAFSHLAIDNLIRQTLELDPSLRILRQGPAPTDPDRAIPGATYNATRDLWDSGNFDVIAGTTWLFSRPDMHATRAVDVLVIDEAGQLGLADALAAVRAAHNVILLGDPLQLPQVRLATHPAGAGASVLEHVLDGAETIAPERGVFLDITRRMHHRVCSFISEQIYESRLDRHPNCDRQNIGGHAELRWIRAHHTDRSTSSPEEATLVADAVTQLLGQPWTDVHGKQRPITANDVMVVAPYNDHVNLLRATLRTIPHLAAVRVGTVDKFQGQEAPAVIFTMATSSGADMPRNAEFLFSRNRLNVAISRARAIATIICTDELLDTRARTVDEMRLIGTLCAFNEHAHHLTVERRPSN